MAVDQHEEHSKDVHALVFPFLAHGHMIPLFDIACIFADQEGVRVTIVTTPANASIFTNAVDQFQLKDEQSADSMLKRNINVEIIPFPTDKVGLPPGVENAEHITDSNDMFLKFFEGCQMLHEPLEELISRLKPTCLISDMFYPWTADVADKFSIPRLVFHGSSFFSMSITEVVLKERPHRGVSSDEEEFIIPNLPDKITMTRTQMSPEILKDQDEEEKTPISKILHRAFEAERKSFGIVMNTFYELEPKYADYSRQVLGKRAWTIGPVSLWNLKNKDNVRSRGKKPAINEEDCLKWLDSKPHNSVIYVSFGSIANISSAQLREIAIALENTNHNFIWVVRNTDHTNNEIIQEEYWLPDPEYEQRNQGKGLIIRGWAQQVLILNHPATAVFVTHCGWNSTLEGVAAGVPMVTWPLFAEQFLNEKLVTQVIKTGVPVGNKKFSNRMLKDVSVRASAIEKAIQRVMMVGDETTEIRKRAEKMKDTAHRAVQIGGSSYQGLNDLLNALRSY